LCGAAAFVASRAAQGGDAARASSWGRSWALGSRDARCAAADRCLPGRGDDLAEPVAVPARGDDPQELFAVNDLAPLGAAARLDAGRRGAAWRPLPAGGGHPHYAAANPRCPRPDSPGRP